MNTTLLIMAAGLGSRYGGNKQIDRIGPNGEILMEYSIHDAVEAGFDKVVTQEDIKSVMGKPMDVIADTLFTYTKKGAQRDALREAFYIKHPHLQCL